MIELFLLFVAGGALARLARLRGGRAWPWVLLMALGYLFVGAVALRYLGPGPDLIARVLFILMLYPTVVLAVGRGRRLRDSWQCPNCQFFNDPTTLVCPCGQKVEEGATLR